LIIESAAARRPGRPKSEMKAKAIRDAASELFMTDGIERTSMDAIAQAAGVSKQTVYSHFKNKDDLLIQLFEDRMDYIIRRLREELAKAEERPLAQLRRLIRLHIDIAIHDPDLAEFITVELRQSSKFVKEYENPQFLEYLRTLRDIIEAGQRSGEIRPGLDSRLIVRAIFGALDEVLLTLTLASRTRSVDVVMAAEQLADLMIDGMAGSGTTG